MDYPPYKYKRILPKPALSSLSTPSSPERVAIPSLPEFFTRTPAASRYGVPLVTLPPPPTLPPSAFVRHLRQNTPNRSSTITTSVLTASTSSSLLSSSISSVSTSVPNAPKLQKPVDKLFSLKWTDFEKQLTSHFAELYARRDSDTDLSIVCGDQEILRAHQLVLSLGSLYFREALQMVPTKHPTVVVRHVTGHSMGKILDYVYLGHVTLATETELKSFFSEAKYLQVVGIQEGKYSLL